MMILIKINMYMKKNYYDVLGVARSSSAEEITKAYKKLVLKYHPDRNKAPEATAKMKENNEAYTVLNDTQSKASYDNFGDESAQGNQFYQNYYQNDGNDMFSDIMSQFSSFFRSGGPAKNHPQKGESLQCSIDISLEEAFLGKDISLGINRQEYCNTCGGSGTRAAPKNCGYCQGTGRTMSSAMFFSIEKVCGHCSGTGIDSKSLCSQCLGSSVIQSKSNINIKIPAGIEEGKMILPGQGNKGLYNGKPGDIIVLIKIKTHPVFRRERMNLHRSVSVNFDTAVLGGIISVGMINGTEKQIRIPSYSQNDQIICVSDEGMFDQKTKKRGNLYVTLKIKVPANLTPEQIANVSKLNLS
jgi:molecular chaperone DnaJ